MIGVADVGAEEDLASCQIEGTQLLGRPAYKSLSIGGRRTESSSSSIASKA